ncbi:hypothetical protein ACHQM5_024827 [Ranunculus cassubicifolius]
MEYSSSSFYNGYTVSQDIEKQTDFLHSVRKPPTKPWRKPVVAPLQPKVYRVVPADFRRIVQQLTGAPEFQSRHLQTLAPAPLTVQKFNVYEPSLQTVDTQEKLSMGSQKDLPEESQTTNYFAMLSPSYYNWSSLPLMSPGTLGVS